MRKPIANAVRKRFEQHLRENLPQFQKVLTATLPTEFRLFEWKVTEAFRLYLLLQLHRVEDSFTVEVGWTHNGRWPEYVSPLDNPNEESSSGDMRFRIGLLWSSNPDYWWDLGTRPATVSLEDALRDYPAFFEQVQNRPAISYVLSKVEPAVVDALQRIKEYVLPYFKRVATVAGIELLDIP